MDVMMRVWIVYITIAPIAQSDVELFLDFIQICNHQYYSCDSGTKNIYCNCDNTCIYYDDCCYDAVELEESDTEDKHLHYLKMTTCESIAFRESFLLTQGVFMISSCPASWDGDVDTKKTCEMDTITDIRDMLPVVDIKTNLTFRNRHCAECHKVLNFIPWLFEIKCIPEMIPLSQTVIESVNTKIQIEQCSYRYLPPKPIPKHYCYREFDYSFTLNTFEGINNSICRNRVFSPVVLSLGKRFHYFRNLQCLIDYWNTSYLEVLNASYCVAMTFNTQDPSITLSDLIDFSSVLSSRQVVKKCKNGEILLSVEAGCQRLYCPATSEPTGDECADIKYTSNGAMIDLLFELDKDENHKKIFYKLITILDTLMSFLRDHTHSNATSNTVYQKEYNITPGVQLDSEKTCCIIRVNFPIKGVIYTEDKLKSQMSVINNFFQNYTKMYSDGSVIKHVPDTQNITCRTNTFVRNPLYLVALSSVDNTLPCPAVKVQYKGNDSDNGMLVMNILNRVSNVSFHLNGIDISSKDIVFANGGYFLCIDTFSLKYQKNNVRHDNTNGLRSIVNTVSTSISLICMIYCLVQLCAIPSLRDGKSDLLIVLISFLLLAQTYFLLISHLSIPNSVCEWVGIIHHISWIGAFVFMFLCSFRLDADIRDLQVYTKSERSVVTVKYILVGFSVPLFIVVCTKIANLCFEPTETWYGGEICFISKTLVLLLVFVIPIILILCGNVFLLIRIIRYISSTSISTNSNKSNVIVFMKISTVMGFSWIVGIIAIFSQSDILLLIFEILSSLQGALITISFSCTSRVRKFYKQRVQRLIAKHSATETTADSCT